MKYSHKLSDVCTYWLSSTFFKIKAIQQWYCRHVLKSKFSPALDVSSVSWLTGRQPWWLHHHWLGPLKSRY